MPRISNLLLTATAYIVWTQGSPAQENPAAESQEKTALENVGKPMVVPFRCTDDDMAWAGMSCTAQEPCPVYFELSAAEPVGDKIFAAGNIHSDTVTLYSILLGSDDNGRTWREAHPRIRGSGLDHIQFTDFANGWVSGESLFPLPQDPFLLITADGGKTWHQQPLFSEPHSGSIQQFFFSSKSQGSLVVDQGEGSEAERYALYESPNAGESWLLKQMSKQPIRLPRAQEPAAGWRLETDRATKSFRLEHRQNERWTPAASFAITIGACKPAPLESKPPEEPSTETSAPVPKRPKP